MSSYAKTDSQPGDDRFCFVWSSPNFWQKNHPNLDEDLFFGLHLFSRTKTVFFVDQVFLSLVCSSETAPPHCKFLATRLKTNHFEVSDQGLSCHSEICLDILPMHQIVSEPLQSLCLTLQRGCEGSTKKLLH